MGNGNRQSRSKSPARGRRAKAPRVRPQSELMTSPKPDPRAGRAAAAPALDHNAVQLRLRAKVELKALEGQVATRSGTDRSKRARSRSASRAVASPDPPSKGKKKKKKSRKELNTGMPSPVVLCVYASICLASLLTMCACYSWSSVRPSCGPLVAAMRLAFAAVAFYAEVVEMMDKTKCEETRYRPLSKPIMLNTRGLRQLCYFTHWSWSLLGLYFFFAALSYVYAFVPSVLLTAAWQVAASNAFLVSFMVSYVIWPDLIKCKKPTENIKRPNVLMMHNLNVVMVACEMYFGRSTVDIEDIGIAPVFGLVYVAFSWWWAPRAQPESGPQYMYFFLDTSLPDKTVVIHYTGLVFVLLIFFAVIAASSALLEWAFGQGHRVAAGVGLAGAVHMVCKWRD